MSEKRLIKLVSFGHSWVPTKLALNSICKRMLRMCELRCCTGRKRTAPWVRQAAGERRSGNIRSDRDTALNASAPSQDAVLRSTAESAALAAHASAVAGATAPPSNAPDIEDLGERAASDACRGDTPEGLCSFYENFDHYFAPQFFKAGTFVSLY